MGRLLVGAGKACIDPAEDMYPMPTKFASCEAKYNSCYVRALAIDNGERKVLFLVYELSDQPTGIELEKEVAQATGFPEEDIIVVVTHNHSSPCDEGFRGQVESDEFVERRQRYRPIELNAGIEAAKQAVAAMRPARYGYGESISNINTNRDLCTPFGYWVEARNPDGYSDKTLSTVKFVDEEGKIIAVLLNHGTHATNIYLMKDFDHKTKLSGNFTGITCEFVEEHYGEGTVCIWTSGAAGNQNPVLSHGLQYEYPDGYSTAVPYPDGVGYMQMEFIGRQHGADAVKGIDAITQYRDRMPIEHVTRDVLLPAQRRVVTKDRGDVPHNDKNGNVYHTGLRQEPYTAPDKPVFPNVEDDPEHPVPMIMQALRLGDIAIVCAGCELYAEIGRDIKEQSPYKKTIVITHTKDHRHVGYVMGKDTAHYKVNQAFGPIKPGASDEIILNAQRELQDEIV